MGELALDSEPMDAMELSMANLPRPEEIARAGSGHSSVTQPSMSEEEPERSTSLGMEQQGPGESSKGERAAKPVDARSSALKALAGISAIVSKSRKTDAEALQAIKSQRARAKAEGGLHAQLERARSGTPPPGGGETTPPQQQQQQGGGIGAPPSSARPGSPSEGLPISAHTPQHSLGVPSSPLSGSLPKHSHSPLQGAAAGCGGGRLPALGRSSMGAGAGAQTPVLPSPPGGAASEFDDLVSNLSLGELRALKEAVEKQLMAKQALALATLQAGPAGHAPAPLPSSADVLSARYAAALLQNAHLAAAQVAAAQQHAQQQAQQQAQQHAQHAHSIHQAIAAAAAASGMSIPGAASLSPEPGLGPHGTPLGASPYQSSILSSTHNLPLLSTAAGHALLSSSQAIPMLSSSQNLPILSSSQSIPHLPDQHGSTGLPTPFSSAPIAFHPGNAEAFSPPLTGMGAAMAAHHAGAGASVTPTRVSRTSDGSTDNSRGSITPEAHLIGDSLHLMLDPGAMHAALAAQQQHHRATSDGLRAPVRSSSSGGLAWVEAQRGNHCASTMPSLPRLLQHSSSGAPAWGAEGQGRSSSMLALPSHGHPQQRAPELGLEGDGGQEGAGGGYPCPAHALDSYLATAVDLSQQQERLPSIFEQLHLQQALARTSAEPPRLYGGVQPPPPGPLSAQQQQQQQQHQAGLLQLQQQQSALTSLRASFNEATWPPG